VFSSEQSKKLSKFTAGNFCVNGTLDAKGMTSLGRNWCSWEENIIIQS
jgi:hypothetical protein